MTTEPITTAEAERHLRVNSDDPGYSDLSAYITAARQTVEQYLNASIVVQTRTLTLDEFPAGPFKLPNGPVLSITSVVYLDTDGAAQTLATSKYDLTSYPLADWIYPAYGETWPSTRDIRGAVTITYQAGMMTGSPLVLDDQDIKNGIKLVLGDLWQNREAQIVGVSAMVNPTVDRLLHFYRRDLGI